VIHSTGDGVVDTALRTQPDVIILDILLPDRSGWDVLTQLRAHPGTASIPVIIVSVVDERSRGSALGAAGYLLKPITRQPFQAALSQVLLPTDSAEDTRAPVVAPIQPPEPPLILLAEDNEANITVMLSYLKAHGLRVAIARNGLEAVQLAKQYQPALIVMDIQMPEMDGLEATRRIRADQALNMTPIIALTALAMPGDRDRCLAAGANEYMTKPVSLKQLLQIIRQYVAERLQ
jgi:CheY-like chemotaxis protein